MAIGETAVAMGWKSSATNRGHHSGTFKVLAEEVWNRIFGKSGLSPSLWARVAFHCKAREHLKDRARYGYRLLVTTTPGDRTLLEASSSLSLLSPYIRPFRLARKYGKSLARRLLPTSNPI